ncbi:MAG: zinc ribbon domain-containing protein [Pedosphaera sp.]|nr:zinc ribbon domain-containing protein [Pedosphaera sp.]
MPIYEYACPKCRRIFSFLSKRLKLVRLPVCPQCGNKKLVKEVSRFAAIKGAATSSASGDAGDASGAGETDAGPDMPNMEGPRMEKFMREMERDMAKLDENNPRHMAHMMRKMKDAMPGAMPKEMEVALRRLEAGEDPEKIEADMGDVLGEFLGEDAQGAGGKGGGAGGYTRDGGLYDL